MVWEIHARRAGRHDDHVMRVKAKWASLDSIDDVSLDCGLGVRVIGLDPCVRREMNAFTKPIDVVLRWDSDIEQPEVFLTWSDQGRISQERVPLIRVEHHVLPQSLRKKLHVRSRPDVRRTSPAGSGGPLDDAGR